VSPQIREYTPKSKTPEPSLLRHTAGVPSFHGHHAEAAQIGVDRKAIRTLLLLRSPSLCLLLPGKVLEPTKPANQDLASNDAHPAADGCRNLAGVAGRRGLVGAPGRYRANWAALPMHPGQERKGPCLDGSAGTFRQQPSLSPCRRTVWWVSEKFL
jgi:hypothetical protein